MPCGGPLLWGILRAGGSSASLDSLYCLTNEAIGNFQVHDYETNAQIPVYDWEKARGRDPYEFFLSGANPLLAIEKPYSDTNKELVVFRDSFGSAIAPLLAEGYGKTTLVDIRYLPPGLLGQFLSFTAQDVLFLYNASVLNHSDAIK